MVKKAQTFPNLKIVLSVTFIVIQHNKTVGLIQDTFLIQIKADWIPAFAILFVKVFMVIMRIWIDVIYFINASFNLTNIGNKLSSYLKNKTKQ